MIFSSVALEVLDAIYEESKVKYKIQQKKGEWLLFSSFVNEYFEGPIDILEIGSWDGGTTNALSYFANSQVTVDTFELPRYCPDDIMDRCDFTYISGDSKDPAVFEKIKNRKFDLLFIDGAHTYSYVKNDFEVYGKLLKSKGVVAFHDIINSAWHRQHKVDIYKYWLEIRNNFKYKEFYTTQDSLENRTIDFENDPPEADSLNWGGIGVICP